MTEQTRVLYVLPADPDYVFWDIDTMANFDNGPGEMPDWDWDEIEPVAVVRIEDGIEPLDLNTQEIGLLGKTPPGVRVLWAKS